MLSLQPQGSMEPRRSALKNSVACTGGRGAGWPRFAEHPANATSASTHARLTR
jgi:hypothetical protein